MREIKYRGKSHDNEGKVEGEWIYGFLAAPDQIMVWNKDNATGDMFQVYPETVGEFTGLHDKNGKGIWEGDIARLFYGIPPTHDTLVIEYADDENVADISVSGWWMRNTRENGCSSSLCKTYENDLEVIGNIHENPELLGESK